MKRPPLWQIVVVVLATFVALYLSLEIPHAEWVKNLAVFAGPAFGLRLLDPAGLRQAALAFVAFCLASSASYAINDVLDREVDARHPVKRHRPVPRGAIHPTAALIFGGVLAIAGAVLSSLLLTREATLLLVLYFALILAYSLALRTGSSWTSS